MLLLLRSAALATVLLLAAAADAGAASRVSVADPAGGARWTATQSTDASGRTCTTLRRGPASKGRTCARLSGRTVYAYVLRNERAARPRDARTALVVTLAPTVVRARLSTPGGARTYRRRSGRARILLAVLAGRVERPTLTVDVRRGGRTMRLVEGPPPSVKAADPFGGPAWRSRTVAASAGQACIAWERVPPRFAATPLPASGQDRCGPAGADVPVAAGERVLGRLVIFGVAGEGVERAVLRTPGGDRALAIESKTRAFLDVLGGAADPGTLRIVARMRDGRTVERALDVVGG